MTHFEIEALIDKKTRYCNGIDGGYIKLQDVNLIIQKAIEVQDLQTRITAFSISKPKISKKLKKELKVILEQISTIKAYPDNYEKLPSPVLVTHAPVQVCEYKFTCYECQSTEEPIIKAVFFTNEDNKREMKQSQYCRKCDCENCYLTKIFQTEEEEAHQKMIFKHCKNTIEFTEQ